MVVSSADVRLLNISTIPYSNVVRNERITYLLSRRGGNEADVSPLRLLAMFRSSAGPGQFPSKNDTGYLPDTAPVQHPYSSGAIRDSTLTIQALRHSNWGQEVKNGPLREQNTITRQRFMHAHDAFLEDRTAAVCE